MSPFGEIRSLKCEGAGINWPLDTDDTGFYLFADCPLCHEPTIPSMAPPLSSNAARRLAIEADFGWWLIENGKF